jgi:hypothetical protein
MARKGQNWECPYCGFAQVVAEERLHQELSKIYSKNWAQGEGAYSLEAVVCANNDCRELSLEFKLLKRGKENYTNGTFEVAGTVEEFRLLPRSFAKPYPDFIPEALRRDYEEACAIRDLSPKASATLIRRCIQGVIRDFCKIDLKDNRLVSEIDELRKRVDNGQAPAGVQIDTVEAIDEVRKIGNIGAHMEADINVIVDVDPDEAQTLIQLTELLFEEWYVQREKRSQNIKKIHNISSDKTAKKLSAQ